MIFQILFEVLIWILESLLDLLAFVIPQDVLDLIDTASDGLQNLVNYGPLTYFFAVYAANFTFTMGLYVFQFISTTYQLIPAKAT